MGLEIVNGVLVGMVYIGIHIWSLFAPIHMKIWPKSKLG